MDKNIFIERLFEKTFDLKEITEQVTEIFASAELEYFLELNPIYLTEVSPSRVCNFLLEMCIKLTKKKVPVQLIKNVYNIDAVKFAIITNNKSLVALPKNVYQFTRVFVEVISCSRHYSDFYKSSNMKYARTTEIAPKYPLELFWIIPLVVNPQVLFTTNLSDYIKSNVEFAKAIGDNYIEDYGVFNDNFSSLDKSLFKQFLTESYRAKMKATIK